jgi:hypothetical protein
MTKETCIFTGKIFKISRNFYPLLPPMFYLKTMKFGESTLGLSSDIRVITKLPNSEQSYKGKVKTHNYINRQNQSTTGKL